MLNTDLSIPYLVKEPSNKELPMKLVLMIHGYGSNEADLFHFSTDFPDNFLVVSVRGTHPTHWGGYCWYDIDFMNAQKFNNVPQAKQSISALLSFVNELADKYSFDKNDVWLCGFSQGCILSYSLALNHPDIFTKIMAISGYPDSEIIGVLNQNNQYQNTHFFVSHGIEDAVIPISWARNGKELLTKMNITHQYKEYNQGHGIGPDNYRDLMLWIDKNK